MTDRLIEPPRDLPSLRLDDVAVVPAGTAWGRIHRCAGPHAVTFSQPRTHGPLPFRFDHHPPPRREHRARSVLYAALGTPGADGWLTCVAELAQGRGFVPLAGDRAFAVAETVSDLNLLDLVDAEWAVRAGCGAHLASGSRSRSRAWARAIYRAYPEVHGIRYPSATRPAGTVMAVWDRGVAALAAGRPSFWRTLDDPTMSPLLVHASEALGVRLDAP